MYLYYRNIVIETNLKYANPSPNYYFIKILRNLKKINNRKSRSFTHSLTHEVCRVKANNKREAVVVCAAHVVKRPSMRSVLAYTIKTQLICIYIYTSAHTLASLLLGLQIFLHFQKCDNHVITPSNV